MKSLNARCWVAALTALSLLSGCGGRASSPAPTASPTAAPTASPSPAPTASPAETEAPAAEAFAPAREYPLCADGVHADVDFADMRWYLYDPSDFYERADRLAVTQDEAEARELYRWLLDEYARLSTLDELAWIDFYTFGTEADSAACQATDDLLVVAGDRLQTAIAQRLRGESSGAFTAFVGEKAAEALSDYEEMSDREVALSNRETELQLEYNDTIDRDDLRMSELNRRAGEIYLELIAIRNELARYRGYDSFAEYAYDAYYARDYSPADAAALCEQIKPYARRYFQNCYYCDAFYADMDGTDERTPEELVAMLREYAPRISPVAGQAQEYMESHGLYRISGEIAELGFTTNLSYYNAPFLYNSVSGSIGDIQSCFHEFGHYYDAYINRPENALTDMGSFDIFEIHSTGLEALSYGWYDEIFGHRAEEARIWCMDSLMYNIVDGCIFDEFQQYVYSHPVETVEELNEAYARIQEEYGLSANRKSDSYRWMRVSHNFESPFYYISYAASALASVQIWSRSQVDRDAALALYNALVEKGAYDYGYCELLSEMGLAVFTDGVRPCLEDFFDDMEDMCLRYDGLRAAA